LQVMVRQSAAKVCCADAFARRPVADSCALHHVVRAAWAPPSKVV